MDRCRCTPTLKCCSEGVANSSLPQLEVTLLRKRADELTKEAMKLPSVSDRTGMIMQANGLRDRADRLERQNT